MGLCLSSYIFNYLGIMLIPLFLLLEKKGYTAQCVCKHEGSLTTPKHYSPAAQAQPSVPKASALFA